MYSYVPVDKRTGKHSALRWDSAMKKTLSRIPPVVIGRPTFSKNLQGTAGFTIIALFTFLTGCGFHFNGSSPSDGISTTGGPGGSAPPVPPTSPAPPVPPTPPAPPVPPTPPAPPVQTIPFPPTFQVLTGCTNPNTGLSNGDWGVPTVPVYTIPDNTSPVLGVPVYQSNSIFWSSRENAPGQAVLLAGAFTDATKTARLALVPPGTLDWQTSVRGSTTVISTTQQGSTGLSFIVPSSFPAGVYGYEIDDPSSSPVLGLANVPSLNWAVGVPSVTDSAAALQHQVYDCGVEQGGILRLFGKNFTAADQVVLQSSIGVPYILTTSKSDTNSVSAPVPSNLAPGNYNVWIGTSPWSAVSSPAAQITVYSPTPRSVFKVTCSGLVGDGTTDNTKALQRCLDLNAPIGSREVAFITIPPGTFALAGGVTGRSFEVLAGSSPALTKFIGQPNGAPPTVWLTFPQYFGLTDLALEAPANPNLVLSSGTTTGNPLTSGHLFVNNVDFESTSDASNGGEQMFFLAGPDIQVYDSYFLSNSNQVWDINFGDGGVVSGNEFVLNNWTGLGISDSQNMIFEGNLIHSHNPLGQAPYGHSGGSGMSISRGNSLWGQSALSRDIYIGNNTFTHMGSGDQQVITNDGDGGSYFGPIASATASTVTLADDPDWNWMGTTNPQAAVLAIVFGTGTGQYSFLQSYSGRTMNLSRPLQVLPDATSVVVISQYELNMTISHNNITDTLGASIVLGDALEGVVEDNPITNSGYGILISAFGPYGGPAGLGPVMNGDVLRNTIAVGDDTYIFHDYGDYVVGIGIQDFPGCGVSGLMVRNNTVPSIQRIFNTDGLNGVSANVVAQNIAYWQPTFTSPWEGFLIEDNTPPPPESEAHRPNALQTRPPMYRGHVMRQSLAGKM
jgi:hypothetical protein